MKIILGSSSEIRKKILASLGYKFEIIKPEINEKEIRFKNPEKLVLEIAKAKAEAIKNKISGPAIIITSDQVVLFNSQIREKPQSIAEAREMIKTAHLYPNITITSVVVTETQNNIQISGVDIASAKCERIPEEIIEAYLATGEPLYMAGSFDIEHPLLTPYIKIIFGEQESILGLPKTLTQKLLKEISEKG